MIIHRYLMREVYLSTLLVFIALLMLFGFFDLVNELNDLGRGDYTLRKVLVFVALSVPGHIYELFPVAVLIGTLFALAQLGANLELTVLRISGLSLRRIAVSLLAIGTLFVVLTFAFGELIVPHVERYAQQYRLRATQTLVAQEFRSGLWVKDRRSFVNVREMLPDTSLVGVKIYEFDPNWRLSAISYAAKGTFEDDGRWRLDDVTQTRFGSNGVRIEKLPSAQWQSALNPGIIDVLLVVPEQMSISNLSSYVAHLTENKQKTTRYEIALWTKLIYPFATLVMIVLALPFAVYRARAGNISGKIFAGIMLGLGFHLLNRVSSYLGLLNDWQPQVSALLPSAIFLTGAMVWLWRAEHT